MGSRGGRRNRETNLAVLHEELSDLTFGLYSAKEIKKLSACLVYNPVSFNQLGHPVKGDDMPYFKLYGRLPLGPHFDLTLSRRGAESFFRLGPKENRKGVQD